MGPRVQNRRCCCCCFLYGQRRQVNMTRVVRWTNSRSFLLDGFLYICFLADRHVACLMLMVSQRAAQKSQLIIVIWYLCCTVRERSTREPSRGCLCFFVSLDIFSIWLTPLAQNRLRDPYIARGNLFFSKQPLNCCRRSNCKKSHLRDSWETE